jgi:hypothetical protein
MEVSGQLHAPAALPPRKDPGAGEGKNSQPPHWESNPRTPNRERGVKIRLKWILEK